MNTYYEYFKSDKQDGKGGLNIIYLKKSPYHHGLKLLAADKYHNWILYRTLLLNYEIQQEGRFPFTFLFSNMENLTMKNVKGTHAKLVGLRGGSRIKNRKHNTNTKRFKQSRTRRARRPTSFRP